MALFFYIDLRRSGFDGIGTFNGLYIHLLRFTGRASGTPSTYEAKRDRCSPTITNASERHWSAFAHNYEILWEDPLAEGVEWVEEEFDALWQDAYSLPDAIISEIKRVADRVEIRFEEAGPAELPAAAPAESPIYRGGEPLQPWQRSFVTMFLQHRETYSKARLLLTDEVGVGKTLSLAASAMLSALLDDGPTSVVTVRSGCPRRFN